MQLKDIFNELIHSELASANLGINAEEGITPYNYPKIVNYVNAALVAIYSRYPLSTREVLIQLQEGQTLYKLSSKFAVSNVSSTEPVKYIIDTSDPFDDLLIKIDEVYNEAGVQLAIDDSNDEASLFRQAYNILQINNPVQGVLLSVQYRSSHPKLVDNTQDLLDQEINLPITFLQAIVLYVVYKYKSSWETQTSQQEAANALQMFNMALESLNNLGLVDNAAVSTTRFGTNGWV